MIRPDIKSVMHFRPDWERWLEAEGPLGLYALVWSWAQVYLYDRERLEALNWSALEHAFDDQIKSWSDACRAVDTLLAMLGDPHTFLKWGDEYAFQKAFDQGSFIGTGMMAYPARDAARLLVKANNGAVLPEHNEDGYPVIGRVVKNSPAAQAGIEPSALLLTVNGEPMPGKSLRDVEKLLNGRDDASIAVDISFKGETRSVLLTHRQVHFPLITYRHLAPDVGYVRIEAMTNKRLPSTLQSALTNLRDCHFIIVDLRKTIGGSPEVCYKILSLFIESGTLSKTHIHSAGGYITETVMLTKERIVKHYQYDEPIEVSDTSAGAAATREWHSSLKRKLCLAADAYVVLLSDGNTRSALELYLAAMRAHLPADRCTIIGTHTLGKGIVQNEFEILDIAKLFIVFARWFTPDGQWLGDAANTVHNGIEPDIIVPANPGLIIGGANDNQLERALEFISRRRAAA